MRMSHLTPLALGAIVLSCQALADVSATAEIGCVYNSARGDTLINPNGGLVVVDDRFCEASINPQFYVSGNRYEIQASTWLRASENSADEQRSDAILGETYFNWLLNDNAQLKLGWFNHEAGSGYAWNPSNPFFDIRLNERDQAIGFKREANMGATFSLTDEKGEWEVKALEFDSDLMDDSVDFNLSLSRHQYLSSGEWSATVASLEGGLFVGANFATTIGNKLELHLEAAYREQSRSLRPNQINAGVGIIEIFGPSQDSGFFSGLLGMQYTFDNGINIIAEYFHQQEGYSDAEVRSLLTSINQQRTQLEQGVLVGPSSGFLASTHQLLRLFRQDYVFLRASFPTTYSVDSSVFIRHNLDDSSFVSGINAEAFISDKHALKLSLQYSDGDSITEGFWVPNRLSLTGSIQFQF